MFVGQSGLGLVLVDGAQGGPLEVQWDVVVLAVGQALEGGPRLARFAEFSWLSVSANESTSATLLLLGISSAAMDPNRPNMVSSSASTTSWGRFLISIVVSDRLVPATADDAEVVLPLFDGW